MNLIILGPQGSGKGTQAEKLEQHFEAEHIDMGKFLREVAKLDSLLGREIHEIINVKKELVDDKILKKVLHIKLANLPPEKNIIFDGVPRREDQLGYFSEALREFGRKVDKVILINLSEKESIERIAKRRVCEKCRRNFILGKDVKTENENCLDCGGKIVQRIDDTEEGVIKRLGIFMKETLPVIEYFKKQNLLIEIDGDQAIEKVFADIKNKLGEVAG